MSADIAAQSDRARRDFTGKTAGAVKQKLKQNPHIFLSYLVLLALFAWMCTVPGFLTAANIYILLHRIVELGLVALGMTLVIMTGGIDLSVASILALSCSLTGLFQHWGTWYGYSGQGSFIAPEPVILLMVLAVGGTIGLLNGLASGVRIPDFAVTLGTMIGIRGAAYAVTGGMKTFGLGPFTKSLANDGLGVVPYVFFLFVAILLLLSTLEKRTALGRSIYAIGENARVAELSGISYLKTKAYVYTISGVLAALAGWVLAGRLNTGDPKVAVGLELEVIAAVIIGGTDLYGGYGGVGYTVPGILIIVLARNLMALYGVSPNERVIWIALILLTFLILQRLLKR
ncbi:MAG: ABC transporter permease [Desulfobacterales bacterium]|nr:MAG: ABC transporter permease [Desulfobacterales bacterium]